MSTVTNFKDAQGHEWHISIDWAAMRRSAAAGVDLSKVEMYFGDWFRGSHTVVDALYAVCQPECERWKPAPLDRDSFEARIVGDVVPAAAEALVDALQNFFQKERAELLADAVQETKAEFAQLRAQLRKSSIGSPATSE